MITKLEGSVPVRRLLNLLGGEVICLLRPYDEDFLTFGSFKMPEGFFVEKLHSLLPIKDDEFVIALFGPESMASNRYKRSRDLDLINTAQSALENSRTVCASASTAIIVVQTRAGQAQISLTKEP